MAYCCIHQGEAAIYIIAQTFPILRVLLQESSVIEPGSPPVEFSATIRSTKTGSLATDEVVVHGSVELVQLASGRIVTALSEEGQAFKQAEASKKTGGAQGQDIGETTMNRVDDEVHRIWAGMGLSKRAWSPRSS